MTGRRVRRRLSAAIAAVLVLLVPAACGAGDSTTADTASASISDTGPSADGTADTATASATDTAPPADSTSAASDDGAEATGAPAEPSGGPAETAGAGTVEGTEVRFLTTDGIELAGTMLGDGPTGVVLAHMRGRDRAGWTAFAREAAAAGHRVLAFDFRGYGASAGTRDTELVTDVAAAVAFLRSQGTERNVVIGASMGGTAAIVHAAGDDLSGVVAISAPGNFVGLDAATAAVDVGEPLLLVAGADDVPYVDDARAMADIAPAPLVEILPGTGHGTDLFADHEVRLTRLLLRFIADRSA